MTATVFEGRYVGCPLLDARRTFGGKVSSMLSGMAYGPSMSPRYIVAVSNYENGAKELNLKVY
jgi:hypothetical protein